MSYPEARQQLLAETSKEELINIDNEVTCADEIVKDQYLQMLYAPLYQEQLMIDDVTFSLKK